jgi:hypothetical protein
MDEKMMCNRKCRLVYLLFIILLITASFDLMTSNEAEAQERSLAWSPQQRIPGYLERTEPPILVVDPAGTVHAFSYQQVGDPDGRSQIAIIHSTWTYQSGWTLPNDIILSPIRNQARVVDVFMDSSGLFHLVFYGGDEQGANIYYSTAPVREAGGAPAWSAPVVVGEQALTPSLARITSDNNGNMVVVYSGNLDGPGLFAVHSTDHGFSWSKPQPYFLTYDRSQRPHGLQLYESGTNGLAHMVWTVVDDRGNKVAGYYAQLDTRTSEFQGLMEIDAGIELGGGHGVADPSVFEYDNRVIIAYNNGISPGTVAPTVWTRVSEDGGLSWSERLRLSNDHVGRNGPVSFAVDSNGQLHAFFGMRIPVSGGAIHGMWQTAWQNGQWSEATPVVSGPVTDSFDPSRATAAVVHGNRVLLTWFTDPGLAKRGVWYAVTELNAPPLPAQSLPVPTRFSEDEVRDQPEALIPIELVAESEGSHELTEDESQTATNPGLPMVISVAAVMLLLILTFVGRLTFYK